MGGTLSDPREGSAMAEMELESYRSTVYETAQAIAPGWERQRARIEEAVRPVREWMVRELALHPCDTVIELAAGRATRDSKRPRSSARPGA